MGNSTEVIRNFSVVLDKPTISTFIPADGSVITNTYTSQANITDTYGLQSVQMYFNGALLPAPVDMANPSYTIDALAANEGPGSIKLVATNTLGKVTTVTNNFNVVYSAPVLSNFLPSEGETINTSYNARVTIVDQYEANIIANFYVDGSFVASVGSTSNNYVRAIDTLNFNNGPHTLEVSATNGVGKTSSLLRNIIIFN